MEKIKVSLELNDIWNREDYRQLCYNIKNNAMLILYNNMIISLLKNVVVVM